MIHLSADLQVITGAVSKPSIGDQTVVILVNGNDNNDHYHRDTPAHQRELQHVTWYVAVEDFHQGEVHVDGLQPHPSERNQQKVMKEPGGGDAETHSVRVESQPGINEEDKVEQQQRQAQLDQDFGWDVFTQLPAGSKWFWQNETSQWIENESHYFLSVGRSNVCCLIWAYVSIIFVLYIFENANSYIRKFDKTVPSINNANISSSILFKATF